MANQKAMKQRDVDDILKKLEESVLQIFSSEYYLKTYLSTYAKFHRYSFNNALWIYLQKPDASHVASFIDWERKFKRKVKKGSKGIKVLVPIKKKFSSTEEENLEDGTTAVKETEFQKLFFKIGNVFDVSDTVGEPLPTLTKILNLNSTFIKELIDEIVQSSTIPIHIETANQVNFGNANGYYIPSSKCIYIREDLPDLQKLKTILHELSHGLQETCYEDKVKDLSRDAKEVIAEATAYTTMELLKNLFNMEELSSDDYSFGYIVSWSSGKELKELKSTLSIISIISNTLFDWISQLTIPNLQN